MTAISTLNHRDFLDAACRNATGEASELVRSLPADQLTRLNLALRVLTRATEAEILRRAIADPSLGSAG